MLTYVKVVWEVSHVIILTNDYIFVLPDIAVYGALILIFAKIVFSLEGNPKIINSLILCKNTVPL